MKDAVSGKRDDVELDFESIRTIEALRLTRLFGEWCNEKGSMAMGSFGPFTKLFSKWQLKCWLRKLAPFFEDDEWKAWGYEFAGELVERMAEQNPGLILALDNWLPADTVRAIISRRPDLLRKVQTELSRGDRDKLRRKLNELIDNGKR